MRCHYATSAWSPSPVSSRATCPYQGHADADPKGASWPGWNRTSVVSRFKAAAPLPTEQPANGAPAECHPRLGGLTRSARSLDPGARCARRDLNPQPPGPRPGASPCWATSTWSRHPVPTRVTRLTRAGPQPCAAAKLPTVDSNHDCRIQSPASCQLNEWALSAEGASRTRTVREAGFEPAPRRRLGPLCLPFA